uniref:Cadherin domain-containing protein n=1 Tax=Amphiprion ocellaris TaxID=80972 RepID=A0AAQ5Y9U5_AMPOC
SAIKPSHFLCILLYFKTLEYINDNFPVFEKNVYKVSISENSVKGASILKLSAKDTDEGLNGEVEYSFGPHTPDIVLSVFDIDPLTGEIRLIGKLDFETNANYEIDICARDKGTPRMEGHCTVHIEVLDVNDNAPNIFLTSQPNSVPEDAPSGTVVALISARDLDSGQNGKVTLQLPRGSPFNLKPSFSDNYALVTAGALDRETFSEYNVEITATDSGSPPLSTKKTIHVSITDVNDNPPVFTQPSYAVYLKENGVPGSILFSVSASDLDFGDNAKISYSILDSKVQDVSVSSYVYINSDNGSIYSMHSFDYEKLKVFQIQVQAKDQGSPSLSSNATVHVFILDQNDNAPAVIYPSSAALGSLSHQRIARDLDSDNNAKVTLKLKNGSPFSLKPSFSNNYALVTNGALDRESFSEYSIEITATDSGSPPLSSKKTIPVRITDVNDNPPIFTQPSYNVYLKENGVPGSILFSVSASDLDFGENAKISYSILDSKVQDVSVSSYVYINSDNGSIYSMHSFDYEKLKVFQIQVQAKDQGSPSLSSNATVHVFILDQNDNAPAVIYPSSAALAGHLVTKVTAVDADSGHNAWISYKVSEATDASLFTVNLYTGEVRTKRAVSEQDDSSQRLLIEIKDDGEPVQSATVTVSILLEDGLHEPILDLRHKSMVEPSKKTGRITLYLILSLASVSVLSLVTFVILAVKCMRSSRSSGSCCMRRSDCDDYKNPNRNLQIQLNTDGPIKYVEVLGGDMLSQSQSFRSCMSPMSEYSDFTLIKPSSTTDFKEVISVLDASLPDRYAVIRRFQEFKVL